MIKGSTYSLVNALRFVVLFVVAACFACSKPNNEPTPTPPPVVPPPSTIPTGIIEKFNIDDTLIGYNKSTYGTWLVTGYNSLTRVKFGGNDNAGLTGPFPTGWLKKDSLFVLSVNSGAQRSQWVHVADTITTRLNNEGKGAYRIKREIPDTTPGQFIDTPMSACVASEAIFFNLDRSTTIIASNIACPSPPAGGPITIVDIGSLPDTSITPNTPGTPTVFMWRNTMYTVVNLTSTSLIVTFKAYDKFGALVTWRDSFVYK
jgi:hypothetical protein